MNTRNTCNLLPSPNLLAHNSTTISPSSAAIPKRPRSPLPRRKSSKQSRRRAERTVASAPTSAAASVNLTRQTNVLKFFAGGISGAISACFTTPLEVLRTRVQASGAGRVGRSVHSVARTIVRNDGLAGFYRGLGVSFFGSLPSRSIYFATYTKCKSILQSVFGEDNPFVHLFSAVAAGGTSNFVMSPLWVVRTRMQLGGGEYKGYIDAFDKMLRNEGVGSFYRGFSASLWGTSEAAIHFVLYEKLKAVQLGMKQGTGKADGRRVDLSPLQYTATAAVSKLIASMCTYPHERVRVLMREVPKAGSAPKYRAMVQSLRLIAREEGFRGLYRGMGCHLARTVPNTAIMFLSYELISKGLEKRHKRKMAEIPRIEGKVGREEEDR